MEKRKPYIAPCGFDKVPISLEYADPKNGNTIFSDFQVRGIFDIHIKEGLPSQQFDVFEFLCGIKFLPTCSIDNGVSWLELYALFLIHTKQTQAPTTAKAGTRLAQRLRDFTSQIGQLSEGFLQKKTRSISSRPLKEFIGCRNFASRIICQPFVSSL